MAKRGIDMAKLAERLAELNTNRGGSGGSAMGFIDIKDGRNVVRILPPKENMEMFYEEVWVHYGVGKSDTNKKGTMIVCPKTNGDDEPCPQCELVDQLFKLSKKKDDSYSKQAKELMKKKRVYYNAIDRSEDISQYSKNAEGKWVDAEGNEGSPVKVLATGIGVFKDLLNIIVDPEYGDITDPEEGLDVIITKTGSGFNTNYDVKTVRKESAVGFDEWEACLNDLAPLKKCKTYDEILAIIDGDTASDDNEADEDEEYPPVSDGTPDEEDGEDLEADIKAALQRRKKK